MEQTNLQNRIMEIVSNGLYGTEVPENIDRTNDTNLTYHLASLDYRTNKMSDEDFVVARAEYIYKTN